MKMKFKSWFPYDHSSDRFHMSPTDRGHVAEASPTVTIIWKPGFRHQLKPGFHMIVTVGDASPRQARGHIGDGCVKWEHFLNDVADVADQTGTVRGRIERVEMRLKRGFHIIITVIVSICRRLIGDTSPKRRRLLRSYGNQALD